MLLLLLLLLPATLKLPASLPHLLLRHLLLLGEVTATLRLAPSEDSPLTEDKGLLLDRMVDSLREDMLRPELLNLFLSPFP